MRRFAALFAAIAAVVFMTVPASAASGPTGSASSANSGGSSHSDAGQESQDAAEAADWFTSQRLAPNGAVDPNAYAAAAAPDGSLFAGAADGGVWKSADGGQHWTPLTDSQATLSIGALLVTGSARSYTVYVGTGEANTSSDSYAGVGVLASTDGGSSWHQVGGPELNGALIFRLAQDGSTLFAATS